MGFGNLKLPVMTALLNVTIVGNKIYALLNMIAMMIITQEKVFKIIVTVRMVGTKLIKLIVQNVYILVKTVVVEQSVCLVQIILIERAIVAVKMGFMKQDLVVPFAIINVVPVLDQLILV